MIRAGQDRAEQGRREGGPYSECIVLICVLQLCVSQILKLVRPLVQPVLQPFYLVRDSVDACVSDDIPIHQGSVPHLYRCATDEIVHTGRFTTALKGAIRLIQLQDRGKETCCNDVPSLLWMRTSM
jgi:hypothetical protein